MLNLKLNRSHLIHKYNVSIPQIRRPFFRANQRLNAKNIQKIVQKSQLVFAASHDVNDDIKLESLTKFASESNDEFNFNDHNSLTDPENKESEIEIVSAALKPTSPKIKKTLDKQKKSRRICFAENEISSTSLINSTMKSQEEIELNDLKDINKAKSLIDYEDANPNQNQNFKSFEPMATNLNKDPNEMTKENSEKVNERSLRKNATEETIRFNNLNDFECMKLFTKYQPNFNYNVIIMLINKEYYYRMKKKAISKMRKNKKKGKLVSSSPKFNEPASGQKRKKSVFNKNDSSKNNKNLISLEKI